MKVTFYGKLADMIGRELELALETPCSVASLRAAIAAAYPGVADALADGRVRACVDAALVADDHIVAANDEVEFLAPVSGG
jgi:molybdopterin converting factor small subunit